MYGQGAPRVSVDADDVKRFGITHKLEHPFDKLAAPMIVIESLKKRQGVSGWANELPLALLELVTTQFGSEQSALAQPASDEGAAVKCSAVECQCDVFKLLIER
jgi:hypothetical protein